MRMRIIAIVTYCYNLVLVDCRIFLRLWYHSITGFAMSRVQNLWRFYIMSNISTAHTVAPFDSKVSQALSGQRLIKIGYKQTEAMTKKGIKALPSICVSVPPIDPANVRYHIDSLLPYVVALCENAQDNIVRGMNDDSAGTLTIVQDSDLSMPRILAQLAADQEGERLTKEKILQWSETSGLADALRLRCAELLGVSEEPSEEQNARIEQQVLQYKTMFSGLAGTKTCYELREATALRKALDLAAAYNAAFNDDPLAARFSARIADMIENPKKAIDLFAL